MSELIREPIGLRVLLRAVRPEDQATFRIWRAEAATEIAELVERGEAEDRAALWAGLLRWSEARDVSDQLMATGWTVTFHGVRAIVLDRVVAVLHPPTLDEGWKFEVGSLRLQAVAEQPNNDPAPLVRLLAFLDRD